MERARDSEVWKQARAELSADELRAQGQIFRPWPRLSPELEPIRQDLLRRMRSLRSPTTSSYGKFAREQEDYIFNSYFTVAMAPWGPAIMIEA